MDAYAVQHAGGKHPDKSVCIHLVGLYLALEQGVAPVAVAPLLQRIAGRTSWPHLDPPAERGALTVCDVALAGSPEEHARLVKEWAEGVWRAWSPHHGVARELAGGPERAGKTDRRRDVIGWESCARLAAMSPLSRRDFLGATAASAAAFAFPRALFSEGGLDDIQAEISKRHAEGVQRLQEWVRRPSIAAENRSMAEGCEHMMRLAREAGFQSVARMPTDGHPGVFATLDTGAARTVGLYFMYDVKQVDPAEWSSPPFEAALVDKPGFGKVLMGRGAVNQKGPEAAFLAALHAIHGAGKKSPVNLVLVAEGEEEIGSPHFSQVVRRPEVSAALKRCAGVFMPSAAQDPEGAVTVSLGAKGVVELELVASGERWGRGPKKDVHSSNRARLDSPAFHLVQALATLVTADGDPAIDGFADAARPASAEQRAMLDAAAARLQEATAKRLLSADRWAHDLPWRASLERFLFTPTVNIEGLVAGYTGPGGKTVLPHRAVAKLDLRLVPDMTFDGAVAALKAHLAKRGFGDVEVNPSGGYDPTSTAADTAVIQAQLSVYRRAGFDPILWPRNAGSYPGYVFTGEPLSLPAAHFGLGHGSGAHAPDEYFVIESSNPKVMGWDGAVRSYVDYLYELAAG